MPCDFPDGCSCTEGFIFINGVCNDCNGVIQSGKCINECLPGNTADSSKMCKPCALTTLKYDLDGTCLEKCPSSYQVNTQLSCVFANVDINPCSLCVNINSCSLLVNGDASCECAPGYFGTFCDTPITEMQNVKSKLDTISIDLLSSFKSEDIENISHLIKNYSEITLRDEVFAGNIYGISNSLLNQTTDSIETSKQVFGLISSMISSNIT